eukprot:1434399-Prymnesium_polylepis.1
MAKRHKGGRRHEARRRRVRGEGSGAANRGHAHRKRATSRGHQRHASTAGKGTRFGAWRTLASAAISHTSAPLPMWPKGTKAAAGTTARR